ncbi:MAG TPA: hypothetical protein VK741_04235 [Acetobacteraceae bacterium]|nr:hypothetical protein [Acetobacteraceae bacterium]
MNEATETAIQALQLPDEAFYAASDAPFEAVTGAIAPASDTVPPGVASTGPDSAPLNTEVPPVFALGLPRVVDVEHNPSIPGALALRLQGLRRWQVDLPQNLCFIMVDLHTGVVKTVTPMLPDKRMATPTPSRSGPEPSPFMRDATSHGVERFTLPDAFGPDWPSTAYAVTAIDYDWITNTVVVERRPPPDPAAEPFRTPSTFLQSASAGTPARVGVSLAVPASVRSGDGIRIEGVVHVPRTAIALAHSTEEPDEFVMAAELLLVQLDVAPPHRVSLGIPVEVTGDTVSATYAFDLATRPEGVGLAGDYQVYLVSGRSVAGPAPLTVLAR